jgi:hypothetical protein
MMQKELEQQNEVFAKQKSAFDSQEISFNQFRDEQMAKNISYNEDYEELKLKGKITRIDYRKVVKYAIGIAAAYYMGKVIGEAIQKRAEEKGVSEAAKSVAGSKSSTLCRYGKVLWSRGNPTAARRYLGKC